MRSSSSVSSYASATRARIHGALRSHCSARLREATYTCTCTCVQAQVAWSVTEHMHVRSMRVLTHACRPSQCMPPFSMHASERSAHTDVGSLRPSAVGILRPCVGAHACDPFAAGRRTGAQRRRRDHSARRARARSCGARLRSCGANQRGRPRTRCKPRDCQHTGPAFPAIFARVLSASSRTGLFCGGCFFFEWRRWPAASCAASLLTSGTAHPGAGCAPSKWTTRSSLRTQRRRR